MPRSIRILGDAIHYHLVLRCNNKERLLRNDIDFNSLFDLLKDVKNRFSFKLYNYVFLNSHIHLMLSTHGDHFVDRVMHDFCFRFAKQYNYFNERSGHFWAHRYRSRVIDSDTYALACLRYLHRNPLSAGIVSKIENWKWSGFHYYVFGKKNELLEEHPSYLGLAATPYERQRIYKIFLNQVLSSDKHKSLFEGRTSCSSHRFSTMLSQIKTTIKLIQHLEPGSNCIV